MILTTTSFGCIKPSSSPAVWHPELTNIYPIYIQGEPELLLQKNMVDIEC